MNPDPNQLSQLRDIHLPDAVSWWPLATAWWLLLGLLLLLGGVAVVLVRRHRAMRWRRVALRELAQLLQASDVDAHRRLCTLSVLLRRVALARFPRRQVAALHGEAWLALITGVLGEAQPVPPTLQRLLMLGPYQPTAVVGNEDLTALFGVAERWIKKLPRQVAR